VVDAPPGYVIDAADTDDADLMADRWVDLAADQRAYGSHLRPADNRDRIHETMLQHVVTDTALVAREAEADGPAAAVVGFVTFGRETGGYTEDVDRGIVHNIYVTPDHRQAGVGSALLAAAERTLSAGGVEAVALEAMAGNDAARGFYRAHGYEPHRVELEKALESDSLTTDDR
jgi:ribosomal protein S18 acetylase RimI-like enzyme